MKRTVLLNPCVFQYIHRFLTVDLKMLFSVHYIQPPPTHMTSVTMTAPPSACVSPAGKWAFLWLGGRPGLNAGCCTSCTSAVDVTFCFFPQMNYLRLLVGSMKTVISPRCWTPWSLYVDWRIATMKSPYYWVHSEVMIIQLLRLSLTHV